MNIFQNKKVLRNLIAIGVSLIVVIVLAIVINNGFKCPADDCSLLCKVCDGDGIVDSRYFATFMSLLPPIIAIVLALITKEVYSSLFVGILAGALFNGNFKFEDTWNTITANGFIASCADSWNAGILVFMVILGIMVALINKAGGARAFGNWAKKHIKTKVGAALATFALGCIIFIDDYFNCLTVGSVMKPVTDKNKISREKLAYLIDATAAPICMIAPISSWAAAVSSTAADLGINGIVLFIQAIPHNYYSLLTIVFLITLTILRVEFGPMKKFEQAAQMLEESEEVEENNAQPQKNSKIIDLIAPIITLIVLCIIGMIYSGGFFDSAVKAEFYANNPNSNGFNFFIEAFANSDASVGLVWGSLLALIATFIYFLVRGLLNFTEATDCIKEGFIAMVPAILILIFAWTLNGVTSSLGADIFVANLVMKVQGVKNLLPAIIFLVALFLAFATGTSWGTFGILIPIVVSALNPFGIELATIGISACLAGAVCGDHISPISDTTIMASAGAGCNHINHVSTQIPYALVVAGISFVMFIIAGFVRKWYISLPIGIALTVGAVFLIKFIIDKNNKDNQQTQPVEENKNEEITENTVSE